MKKTIMIALIICGLAISAIAATDSPCSCCKKCDCATPCSCPKK